MDSPLAAWGKSRWSRGLRIWKGLGAWLGCLRFSSISHTLRSKLPFVEGRGVVLNRSARPGRLPQAVRARVPAEGCGPRSSGVDSPTCALSRRQHLHASTSVLAGSFAARLRRPESGSAPSNSSPVIASPNTSTVARYPPGCVRASILPLGGTAFQRNPNQESKRVEPPVPAHPDPRAFASLVLGVVLRRRGRRNLHPDVRCLEFPPDPERPAIPTLAPNTTCTSGCNQTSSLPRW